MGLPPFFNRLTAKGPGEAAPSIRPVWIGRVQVPHQWEDEEKWGRIESSERGRQQGPAPQIVSAQGLGILVFDNKGGDEEEACGGFRGK